MVVNKTQHWSSQSCSLRTVGHDDRVPAYLSTLKSLREAIKKETSQKTIWRCNVAARQCIVFTTQKKTSGCHSGMRVSAFRRWPVHSTAQRRQVTIFCSDIWRNVCLDVDFQTDVVSRMEGQDPNFNLARISSLPAQWNKSTESIELNDILN